MVEKVRIGDFGPAASANANSGHKASVEGTDEFSHSP